MSGEMTTRNEIVVGASVGACFRGASDVERWPELLPHYRRVRFRRRDGPGRGLVEMAASRGFGPLSWPVWWASEMWTSVAEGEVHYRHVEGVTRGMRVVWRLRPEPERPATRIVIVHEWGGPAWPVFGGWAAHRVIGPHFVSAIAERTLEGIKAALERSRGGSPG